MDKVLDREALIAALEEERAAGRTIVFTNGCYDVLHTGHLRLLQQAAELGDEARAARYRDALVLGLHNLRNLQFFDERMYFIKNRPAVDGAFRIHVTDNRVRVDSVQHALDGFAKIAKLLEQEILTLEPR